MRFRWLSAVLALGAGAALGQDAAPAKPIGPVRISGGVMTGQILTRVAPIYPVEAKQNGIQGAVVLRAVVAKDGTVRDLTVVSGNQTLAVAAMDAVRGWTYKPYLLNGEPTEVDTTVTVNFTLARPVVPKSVDQDGAPAPDGPLPISSEVMMRRMVWNVAPEYPPEAKSKKVQGVVMLDTLILKDGTVGKLTVVSGDPALVGAAEDAVKQWVFRPWEVKGVTSQVETLIVVRFNLNH